MKYGRLGNTGSSAFGTMPFGVKKNWGILGRGDTTGHVKVRLEGPSILSVRSPGTVGRGAKLGWRIS